MSSKPLFAFAFFVLFICPSYGKRAAPPLVDPVVKDSVQYYPIPNSPAFWEHVKKGDLKPGYQDKAGVSNIQDKYIVAWDLKEDRQLWQLKIYSIEYDRKWETDVQDICIKEMSFKGNNLLIKNEANDLFTVNIMNRTVKPQNKVYKRRFK